MGSGYQAEKGGCDRTGGRWDKRQFIEIGQHVDRPSSHRATRRWPRRASNWQLQRDQPTRLASQSGRQESTRPFHGKTSGGAIVLLLLLLLAEPLIVPLIVGNAGLCSVHFSSRYPITPPSAACQTLVSLLTWRWSPLQPDRPDSPVAFSFDSGHWTGRVSVLDRDRLGRSRRTSWHDEGAAIVALAPWHRPTARPDC